MDKPRRLKDLTPEEIKALITIESSILHSARNYLTDDGFKEVLVPHITKSTGACENPDTLFEVIYFDDKINPYLSQTGQLYLEIVVSNLKKVWCYGPSFRKEEKVDNRHLTEFSLLEMEFCGDFNQLLFKIEELIKTMVDGALTHKEELETLGINYENLKSMKEPFNKITYDKAIDFLNLDWGADFSSTDEKTLVEQFHNKPVFVTHFPEKIKFFNMKRNSEDFRIVNSADLLLPYGGESVGAAEREIEYTVIKEKLENSQMFKQLVFKGRTINDFDWYLESLKNGKISPHAGCGVGVERVIKSILAKDDIRESTLFPLNRVDVY